MKNNIVKFLIRLSVVVLGVLISFSIEKKRALSYKEDLKNKSLRKLIENIKHDIEDQKINYNIHAEVVKSGKRLENASVELFQNNKDSLGYYIKHLTIANTIFVDNKEEYLTLRNSGLLELIENDSLVSLLHKKYSYHQFYKELEKYIGEVQEMMTKSVLIKCSHKPIGSVYWASYGTYIHASPLSNDDLLKVREKFEISELYSKYIKERIQQDSTLIEMINQELANTE